MVSRDPLQSPPLHDSGIRKAFQACAGLAKGVAVLLGTAVHAGSPQQDGQGLTSPLQPGSAQAAFISREHGHGLRKLCSAEPSQRKCGLLQQLRWLSLLVAAGSTALEEEREVSVPE